METGRTGGREMQKQRSQGERQAQRDTQAQLQLERTDVSVDPRRKVRIEGELGRQSERRLLVPKHPPQSWSGMDCSDGATPCAPPSSEKGLKARSPFHTFSAGALAGPYEGREAEECGILDGCAHGRCVRVPEGFTCDCFDGYRLDMTRMACVGEGTGWGQRARREGGSPD